jgi:signal transduction histidine kinase
MIEGKLKILILEDSPSDIEFIKRGLKKSGMDFTSHVVDTREEFIEGITQFKPEVILSDHSLPQFNSIEALRIAREYLPGVPFILVTGAVSEEFAVAVIKEGADDYILKDHLIRLPSAIENALLKKKAEKEREKMLEQMMFTNNELNTFVYKATHDLRGPLTSIMGLTKLAEREENKGHAGAYLKMIAESTEKLDTILIGLIETMTIKNAALEISKINISQMLDSIFKQIEFNSDFQRVIVGTKFSNRKNLFTDEKILHSILQNLIENAIKYQNHAIPKPRIQISVSDFENMLRIEISDNGIGINPNIQNKIFDMFYRGNEISGGSGLGLYLVKNGIQRLGGKVKLKSDTGQGTTISLFLPANNV